MSLFQLQGTGLRLLTALLWLPFVVAVVWIPAIRWAFILLVMFLSFMGAREFFALTREKGIGAHDVLVTVLAPLLVAGSLITDMRMILLAELFIIIMAHVCSSRHTIAGLSASVFGLIYAGYLPVYFVALHTVNKSGPALVTILLVVIAVSDTGAYAVGRRFGRHKLAPKVSPNKTVEGAIAAVVCAAMAGLVLFALKTILHWDSFPAWSPAAYVLAAILLSVIGQVGDLTESLLKRDAGVKDSGSLFPGHGGVLDRCDAFLFGGPVLHYFCGLYASIW
ncbi:MAG TPA: phosphatidate cytidylyltransferase [Candidatus Hydrogenedentes bacterium]|jgi:phosphatidate cytidylyltransferase|nr:phosphatidate cytidylyltransferase [Candidatus Hydrogenedentota bacterium]HQM99982.1 phosphatidate cytidylyltransferase [Candidatus Hydrogenedentota bacterium]